MYIYIYIYACIHAYMHVCIHAYMHTCTHAYIHTCIHAYMHTCIHAYIHTYIHTHTYTHTCIPIAISRRPLQASARGERGERADGEGKPAGGKFDRRFGLVMTTIE